MIVADDFGISPAVDDAILELADRGRIQATSVMVTFTDNEKSIARLRSCTNLEAGLHWVLTDHKSLTKRIEFPSYKKLFRSSHLGRIDAQFIREELEAQWRQFEDLVGKSPCFIDGHQHVHLLPGVRNVLSEFAEQKNVWVRNADFPEDSRLSYWGRLRHKALTKQGGPLKKMLKSKGVRHNRFLFGFQSPGHREDFFAGLQLADETDVFYCHPGHVDRILASRDRLLAVREDQFRWLLSLRERQ